MMMLTTKNKKLYLTGLKGIACIFVFFGHYIGIYRNAQSFFPKIFIIDTVLDSCFYFIINESFWLYLFFVISGYLISQSNVCSIKDVIYRIISRLLRFVIPIFFSALIIYLLYLCIGFYNRETISLFQCSWYQNFYNEEMNVFDVFVDFINIFLYKKSKFNAPYWVIKEMLISSCIIYFFSYLLSRIPKRYINVYCVILFFIICLFKSFSIVISSCLYGMLINLLEEKVLKANKYLLLIISIIVLCCGIISFNEQLFAFYFGFLVLLIPRFDLLNRIISSKSFLFLGKVSWGVYSFHWPLICSVGGYVMLLTANYVGLVKSYILGLFIVFILTIVISFLFSCYIERISNSIIDYCKYKMHRLIYDC